MTVPPPDGVRGAGGADRHRSSFGHLQAILQAMKDRSRPKRDPRMTANTRDPDDCEPGQPDGENEPLLCRVGRLDGPAT